MGCMPKGSHIWVSFMLDGVYAKSQSYLGELHVRWGVCQMVVTWDKLHVGYRVCQKSIIGVSYIFDVRFISKGNH